MRRSLILFAFIASFLAESNLAQAKSSTQKFEFTSSVEGATVTVMKHRSHTRKKLGECETPCALELKPSKMGVIFFTHPDYPQQSIKRSKYEKALKSDRETIRIRGNMGLSTEERIVERAEKYRLAVEVHKRKNNVPPKSGRKTALNFRAKN